MRNVSILLLMALLAMGGCGREDIVIDDPAPVPEPPDASVVVANCAALQAAVEQFAAENEGVYPDDMDADTSRAGNTVLDLLPAGGFENPFTKDAAAPVNGIAASPGEVAYQPVDEGEWRVGYVVTGFGADELVATLSNLGSPEEAKVIANCFIVKQAAEDMLAAKGEYPYETDYRNWWHLHMPQALINPYTGIAYYPPGRTACSPGEIGYVAILQDDVPIGYVVTGYGDGSVIFALSSFAYSRAQAVVASDCRTLQRSVDEYPDAHGGLYPNEAPCMPAVSYQAIVMNGWNVGYRIVGTAQGSDFIEIATPAEETKVRLNCLLLKQAVEESAAQNEGVYPETVEIKRIPGGSVIDLLPRAHMLENPYTGTLEAPVNHSATRPGEIGYAAIPEYRPLNGRYVPPGYVITGFVGVNRQIVVTNLRIGAIEAIVMSHCRTVQLAVEKFAARNNGIYPDGVDWGPDLYGEILIELLPGEAFLINPATGAATEPVDGWAAEPGEIGYMSYHWHGEARGYAVTGMGLDAYTTIMVISKETPQ